MFFKNKTLRGLFLLLLCGVAANAAAHRYFFSLTDVTVNSSNKSIEIIHQISAHDIDNLIAQEKQIHFSVAHPDYETFIRQYIEEHFQLSYNAQMLTLNWIGLEISKGYIVIYQEIENYESLVGLKIINSLLVEYYAKQVNTVNYRDKKLKGSLTFTKAETVHKIINQ